MKIESEEEYKRFIIQIKEEINSSFPNSENFNEIVDAVIEYEPLFWDMQ